LSASIPNVGLTYTQTRKVFQALTFAAHKHRNQRRKNGGTPPHINHAIARTSILVNEAGIIDHVVLCAAILHDTIKHTETSYDELVTTFGRDIANVVAEGTDENLLDPGVLRQLAMANGGNASPEARLIKLADKTCNLRDLAVAPPPDWSEEQRQAYFERANDVVAGARGANAALDLAFDRAFANRPGPA
jgi:guanosine-3',5'-bis(diphosphate) 3'-pyrophosphohydrolase